MNNNAQKGARFTHAYLERGEPTADSARMRHRLASLIFAIDDLKDLGAKAGEELGVTIPHMGSYYGSGSYGWREFISGCELRDVLDLVTIAWRYLIGKQRGGMRDLGAAKRWLAEVSRIFAEEHVGYRVDERGGVHFAIDGEFEGNRVATLAILGTPRYANVLSQFDAAHDHLATIPQNGKDAIRATFAAAEGLFRLMFTTAPRLGSKEIDKHLAPRLQRIHAGDPAALGAASKLLTSFGEWVDAAHFYRHEAGKESVAQPPFTLTISLVSLGATYIRWLAEIDALEIATE